MRKISLLTVVLTLVFALSTWAADISGKWTLTMWGAGAEESVPLEIKASGENFTVTCFHPNFKEMTGKGTLKGDEISFNLKSSSMEIAFTGKVDGNKMEGVREIKASPQGGMSMGTDEGRDGGAPAAQQGTPQGSAPGGAVGSTPPGGGQGGAVAANSGGAQAQSSENWTAVRN